jgi:hypothetical protein
MSQISSFLNAGIIREAGSQIWRIVPVLLKNKIGAHAGMSRTFAKVVKFGSPPRGSGDLGSLPAASQKKWVRFEPSVAVFDRGLV